MQTRVWMLMAVSFCAALVTFAFVYVSVTLASEAAAANPTCATPAGLLLQTIDMLHTALLTCGVAGLLSWACAFIANRIASASTRWERTSLALLWLSSLALVGFALSCGYAWVTSYSGCFA